MLTENDVVDAVARHLQRNGWRIECTSSTHERSHDILATKGETTLAIEAKGETSSDPGSSRFGKPFDSGQKRSHVAVALYKAACVFSATRYRPAIALPATDRHLTLIEAARAALEKLHVTVFLVDDDRTVREWP